MLSTDLRVGKTPINYPSLLRGIASFVLGILLLTHAQKIIEILILLLGLWWLIDGLFRIISIFVDDRRWGWKLLGRSIGVLASLMFSNSRFARGVFYFSSAIITLGILGSLYGVIALIAAY